MYDISMTYRTILTLIIAMAGACAAGCAGKPSDTGPALEWGNTPNLVQMGNLYFAGQPDVAGLAAAKEAGVDIVVNLRMPDEMKFDEASAVAANGMEYFMVPISGDQPSFEPGTINMISELVAANHDKQILVHCASSNRVGAWYAIHLVEQEGIPLPQAMEIGRRAGMTRPALEKRVREYLGAGD